jgi:hypothetical protein
MDLSVNPIPVATEPAHAVSQEDRELAEALRVQAMSAAFGVCD